ncbi:GNAT family N-acetyltransferase [Paracoccus aeridis]|uniref:GNAT family N-acetyltransferase n=1 Tax=Paracoccus aeridis TaxID=1966466 RepID=UPI0010AB4739|nr:GNAT family protein [Paracoccus aeridis]
MFLLRRAPRLVTERMVLRLPAHGDFGAWTALRHESRAFLTPWEPVWHHDHLTRKSFTNRVYWAQRASRGQTSLPLFMVRHDGVLVGAITLDNIRRGPAQTGTLGYWIGAPFARQGYMGEAIRAVVAHAFDGMELSRIEAACLPENVASRGVLEKSGFKYEGVAQSYLQIHGRWRNHVLYSILRGDRRGRTGAG